MVGKNIKRYRVERGLTQDALAEKLNVTRQAVSNWENEKTEPDIDTLHRIAASLDVSIEELIYGERRGPAVIHQHVTNTRQVIERASTPLSVGAAVAAVISYVNFHSIGWAIVHGFLGWAYVVYYVIRYGWH